MDELTMVNWYRRKSGERYVTVQPTPQIPSRRHRRAGVNKTGDWHYVLVLRESMKHSSERQRDAAVLKWAKGKNKPEQAQPKKEWHWRKRSEVAA